MKYFFFCHLFIKKSYHLHSPVNWILVAAQTLDDYIEKLCPILRPIPYGNRWDRVRHRRSNLYKQIFFRLIIKIGEITKKITYFTGRIIQSVRKNIFDHFLCSVRRQDFSGDTIIGIWVRPMLFNELFKHDGSQLPETNLKRLVHCKFSQIHAITWLNLSIKISH